MNSDSKITISVGCADYLVKEVEQTRRQNELLSAEKRVMDNFFSLVNRIGDLPRQGYGEDRLYQAKKEIETAKNQIEKGEGQ